MGRSNSPAASPAASATARTTASECSSSAEDFTYDPTPRSKESVIHSPADLDNDSSISIVLRDEKHIELIASQATCGVDTRGFTPVRQH